MMFHENMVLHVTWVLNTPVIEGESHGDDGEDGEGEGHDPHHEPPCPQVDTAAAPLEAGHGGGQV